MTATLTVIVPCSDLVPLGPNCLNERVWQLHLRGQGVSRIAAIWMAKPVWQAKVSKQRPLGKYGCHRAILFF